MHRSPGPLLRPAMAGVILLAALCTPVRAQAVTPAPEAAEARRLPFTERYRATLHGGIVRAANTSVSCRATGPQAAPTCPAVRAGGKGANGDFDMFYVDVDRDPNTYNSSRADVRLPEGSRVTYARLYWGGNLRVGEQKPPKDNGRVLIAEPGGRYKALLADTVVGHRVAHGADAFQASADVTGLVRDSGSGLYTVAQVNAAMGRSTAGAWGGWTLVVAYENPDLPLRHLAVLDGFDALDSRTAQEIRLGGLRLAGHGTGRVGLVAYDGDRGRTGDSLTVSTGRGPHTVLAGPGGPRDDVLNSTISEAGAPAPERVPSYAHTLGYDSDVFELGNALRRGGDHLAFRLVSQRDAAWAGALFVVADARQQARSGPSRAHP
ncbi:hypothetical protein M2164_005442 [Streptomyces sp. SAI-208]|uniref:DUF3344 domain-containing protein n=1 Tax=Streptomyces sp. SAI-208 TaxID=2940550 RepID=UPI002474743A|nr:DUF3344 domain-containing protein [Streptomyces sp. SAI-208]MDH6609807.1 hypothetical protein [Streptomyces sp. SAI-208]